MPQCYSTRTKQWHQANDSLCKNKATHLLRVVVLLKNGELAAVECPEQDLFLMAQVLGAGICGTFDDRPSATAFIAKLRAQQRSILGWQAAATEHSLEQE